MKLRTGTRHVQKNASLAVTFSSTFCPIRTNPACHIFCAKALKLSLPNRQLAVHLRQQWAFTFSILNPKPSWATHAQATCPQTKEG